MAEDTPTNVRTRWGPNTGKDVLGSVYYLDANAFIELTEDPSSASPMGFLYRAFVEGWVGIGLTDTTSLERMKRFGTELGVNDPALWAFESFGPMVPGHSRPDSSVVGSSDDTARLSAIHRVLKPGKSADQLRTNDFRDGMQINTTLRYGGRHLLAGDGNILNHSRQLRDQFELTIATPMDTKALVVGAMKNARAREAARDRGRWLPSWPSQDELESQG